MLQDTLFDGKAYKEMGDMELISAVNTLAVSQLRETDGIKSACIKTGGNTFMLGLLVGEAQQLIEEHSEELKKVSRELEDRAKRPKLGVVEGGAKG